MQTLLNERIHVRTIVAVCVCGIAVLIGDRAAAAEKIELQEPAGDSRVFQVDHELTVTGKLETSAGNGQTRSLDLKVKANHTYRERRLSGTGRDAAALRTLRHFDKAEASIVVDGQMTSSLLRNSRQSIVAQGRRDGVFSYCPEGPMTVGEVELLEMPGDSLAVLALLPLQAVEVGDEWEAPTWAIQMLTATEAVLKSEMTCKLENATAAEARISFRGSIDGATDGAGAKIALSGTLVYDVKRDFVRQLDLTQTEDRTVGAVSPGMKVEARVTVKRQLADNNGPLTDRAADRIPLEPDGKLLLLTLQTPWGMQLQHGRDWRLFHQSKETSVLRLLDTGSLIAQCNLTRIPSTAAGKHTPEKQFQEDVRQALGERLKSITGAEQLEVDDGRFLYRVTAVGEANGVDMHWYYYLCAAPTGEQATFVFAVETKQLKELANRDLAIVNSIAFPRSAQAADRRD